MKGGLLGTVLPDVILGVHFVFVAFIVGGFILTWIGYFRHWTWVRNLGFRIAHLLAIAFVVLESLVGAMCPLTTWEDALRRRSGAGQTYSESFVQHWLGRILFHDVSEQALTTLYLGFFGLVLLTLWLVPPLRSKRFSRSDPC